MHVTALDIPDVKLIAPKRHGDARGFFCETYSQQAFANAGIDIAFVQDNESLSAPAGTLRGLHLQSPPHGQDKLVRVLKGSVIDVAVDIRRGSPTYGQHVSAVLSADNGHQLLVPIGFAHGFATLEPDTHVCYKVSDYYAPQCDGGIAWDDADLGIDWRIDPATATLSDKDRKHPTLAEFDSPFIYEATATA